MKPFPKILILAAGVVLLTARLAATSYYVDYTGGANTNAGTSTTSAWKNCPGDPVATNNASSAILAAGDKVFFKGGVTYIFTGSTGIILKWNGTSTSPIVYDGNSAGTWGSGRALMTDNYSSNNISAFSSSSASSYITINNFDIGPIGGSASLPTDGGSALASKGGSGVAFNSGITGGVVSNCLFHALGYWFNQKPMGTSSISGTGIYVRDASGLTVTNCDFTKVSSGCELTYGSSLTNVTVSNCTFHDYIRWCVDFAPTANNATMNHINVMGCKFYEYYQFDQNNWTGYGDWPHTDGIFHRSDYSGINYGADINFYNNDFYQSQSAGGTASIYITEGPNANIYNNTFRYQGKGRTIYFYNSSNPSNSQVVNIVNNSFVTDYIPCISIESNCFTNSTITVKNNAFYDIHTGSGNNFCVYTYTTDPLSNVTFDYNIYKSFNTASAEFFDWANGIGEGGLTIMQSHSWETHGLNADSKFSTVATQATASLADLHLTLGSPAVQAGANLSSLGFPGLTSDKDGNARSTSGAWDIGAYKYTGTVTTVAPSNAVTKITSP